MANQAFRDVNTTIFGATAIQGVTSVRLGSGGETLDFHADADAYRQDVGLTKQLATIELERISPHKLRDVLSAVFTSQQGSTTGQTIFGRVQRAAINQSGKVLRDSGDADAWIRSMGLTEIKGQATVEFRDQAQLDTGVIQKGKKGTLTIKVPIPRTGWGLPALTATETHKVLCMVSDIEKDTQHGELASGRVTLELYSSSMWTPSGVTGGKQTRPIAVGWKGTVSWIAPAADGGSAENTSVANALLHSIDTVFAHGEFTRATYRFEAHSSDGSTSPIT